jgi:hypothetical protein
MSCLLSRGENPGQPAKAAAPDRAATARFVASMMSVGQSGKLSWPLPRRTKNSSFGWNAPEKNKLNILTGTTGRARAMAFVQALGSADRLHDAIARHYVIWLRRIDGLRSGLGEP